MTSAKALGCGVPVGAFLMTEKVAELSLAPGDHGTTYGGNPFVGAAVSTVLKQFEELRVLDNVNEVTPYLEDKLEELVNRHESLTQRRGMGFMQGVETSLSVGEVAKKALEHGLVVISAGSNVIRMVPPLVITKENVDEMIEKLDAAITELE